MRSSIKQFDNPYTDFFGNKSRAVRGTLQIDCQDQDALMSLDRLLNMMEHEDILEFTKIIEDKIAECVAEEIDDNVFRDGRTKLKLKNKDEKVIKRSIDSIGSLEI